MSENPMNTEADSEFRMWLGEVESHVDNTVGKEIRWYDSHTKAPWMWFRVCGSLLIFISISLPIVSSTEIFPFVWKGYIVSFMSFMVALLSSFGAFFHWHDTWRENIRAKVELQNLLKIWKLKLLGAQQIEGQDKRVKEVIEITRQLLVAAGKVSSSNTKNYFKNIEPPSFKK